MHLIPASCQHRQANLRNTLAKHILTQTHNLLEMSPPSLVYSKQPKLFQKIWGTKTLRLKTFLFTVPIPVPKKCYLQTYIGQVKVCFNLQKYIFSFIRCLRTWAGEEVQNHNQPPKLLNSMATPFSAILTQNTHFCQRLSTGKLDDPHLLEGTIWAIIFVLVIFLLVYGTYLYFWGWHSAPRIPAVNPKACSSSAHFQPLRPAQFIQPHVAKRTYYLSHARSLSCSVIHHIVGAIVIFIVHQGKFVKLRM